jgi:hypothetical protein
MQVNIDKCINEYLAFQQVMSENICWKEDFYNTFSIQNECPRYHKVRNGNDCLLFLKSKIKEILKNYNSNEIGILISSGIDSGSLAKLLPKNSNAFYATYKERKKDPEIEITKKYCEINKLNLNIIEVSWNDYENNMDYLMNIKKSPLHPCEIPIYMCCKKAKELGVKSLISGFGADIEFGGMDKLLSKDWMFNEFKKRYEYCPRITEINTDLDNKYLNYIQNNFINIQQFLKQIYGKMTFKAFYYIPNLFNIKHIPLWDYLKIDGELDINRIRNGEPKYIIRETFKLLYKNDNIGLPNKIPFTRPTDIYMKEHFYDIEYTNKLKKYINDIKI